MRSRFVVTNLLVVVTAAGGCAPDVEASTREALPFAAADADNAPPTSEPGPYPVGVRTTVLLDDLRLDDDGNPRALPLEIWYPADEAARAAPTETIRLYDALPPDLQADLTPDALGALPTIAHRDAAARHDDDDRYPLIVFSHGKGGIRTQSNFYTATLASHGYVVVAPDHSGDTVVELLREVKSSGEIRADSTVQALVDRPLDVIAILDLIADVADDDIAAIIDHERVGVTGHSFGALTSFITASKDFRVDAVVGQAPTSDEVIDLQSTTPMSELTTPSLIQSATLDATLPEAGAQALYETLASPTKAWLSLARAGHFTYSDLCVLDVDAISEAVDLDVSNVLDDGCGPEALPTTMAFPMINATAIGFFNLQLRNSGGSAAFVSQRTVDSLAAGEGTVVATGIGAAP